jgi:hypothetical protein
MFVKNVADLINAVSTFMNAPNKGVVSLSLTDS